jgi:DNA topoisomerase-1
MKKGQKTLVIVESPSKAKTIHKYLGTDYIISSSMGHIIDLPKSRLAVDVENDFYPEYITIRGRAKILNDLKKKAAQSSQVLLATDPDREGEAISWHLSNALSGKNSNIKRIEFNEITEDAIKEAIENKREIDIDLVNAQQARRILDRIVGYYISPILWKKVKKGLSAGRVQSVALKTICDREREIENFIPEEYWNLDAILNRGKKEFKASFFSFQGERLKLKNREEVDRILEHVREKRYIVRDVQKKERKRNAPPPFITSRLQQEASNKLGFTSQKTMSIAQDLYEGVDIADEGPTGLITYMRTDSTRVSNSALESVREYIKSNYREGYLPESPNFYKNKKGSQDAHEAVRPTDVFRVPEDIKGDLTRDQYKLYSLIWKRFVSSQMTPEVSVSCTALIQAGDVEFKATGSKVLFNGFTAVYRDEKKKKQALPDLNIGDEVMLKELLTEQRFTSPPPRYNDASLVRFLEESGIGRPSTYAPTIGTIIKRYYITRSGKQLVPTVLGKLVNDIMAKHFESLVSVDFTANMEEKLDQIEESKSDWVKMLREFHEPFKSVVEDAEQKIEDMKNYLDEETDIECDKCGKKMVKKLGKYGFFLACPGFPECRNSKSLPLGNCPVEGCDGDVVKRTPKKGRSFYACTNYPDCTFVTREIPSDKHCPKCDKVLFSKRTKRGETLECLNEKCGYRLELLDDLETNNNDNGEIDRK